MFAYFQGNLLDRMAEAVENSSVVLMCLAPEYERSDNCRLEAEYCIQRKVPFIPLILAPGFSPRGWLGILKGQKLYYDFSNSHAFDVSMKGVISEIDRVHCDSGAVSNPTPAPAPAPAPAPVAKQPAAAPAPTQPVTSAAKTWEEELKAFLVSANAGDAYDVCVKNVVDVETLQTLTAQEMFAMGVPMGLAKRIGATQPLSES